MKRKNRVKRKERVKKMREREREKKKKVSFYAKASDVKSIFYTNLCTLVQ